MIPAMPVSTLVKSKPLSARLPGCLPGRDGSSVIVPWANIFVVPQQDAIALAVDDDPDFLKSAIAARELIARTGFVAGCPSHYVAKDADGYWFVHPDPERRISPDHVVDAGLASYVHGYPPCWNDLPEDLQLLAGGDEGALAVAFQTAALAHRIGIYGELSFREASLVRFMWSEALKLGRNAHAVRSKQAAIKAGKAKNAEKMKHTQDRRRGLLAFVWERSFDDPDIRAMVLAREIHARRDSGLIDVRPLRLQADPRETQKEISVLLHICKVCRTRENGRKLAEYMVESHEGGDLAYPFI